jgi:hypothetical protein
VAYRYFWFSEGALRENGDSVPKHTGSDQLASKTFTSTNLRN